jgi:hypothetical protein
LINKKYFEKFNCNPGLTENKINKMDLPKNIPSDYFELIKFCNGGEGFIGEEYVVLYKLEELKQINIDYNVQKYTPEIFLFGSNGADEAIAFDFRTNEKKYILIPFIFEYDGIIELGDSINEFLERIFSKGFFDEGME